MSISYGPVCQVCVCVTRRYCIETAAEIELFWHVCFHRLILYCVLKELGFLQNKGTSLWNFVPHFGLRKFGDGTSAVANCVKQATATGMLVDNTWRRWTWSCDVNSRPTTVTCWSHSASGSVCSAMVDWAWGCASRGSICISWDLFSLPYLIACVVHLSSRLLYFISTSNLLIATA